MSSKLKLTISEARRLALHASLLYGKPKLPIGKEGVRAVISHLGYTQIDTISVIERAHNHTLWTRCPDYQPEYLHQLLAEDKGIFEYWGHAMSFLPIEDYRFYMHAFKRFKTPSDQWSRMRLEKTKSLLPKIMKRIKSEGALGSKDFENTSTKKASGWWDWKPAKIGLELLYWQGKLMVASRENFHRKYDLTKRVLPAHINTKAPTKTEQVEFWISRALNSYGVATISEIKKHIHQVDKKAIENYIPKMVTKSKLVEIEIAGLKDSYFALPEFIELSYPIKKVQNRIHLLSPFDNFIIQRERIQKLFNFEYTIECYLPKPKRTYGYFVLPILWGENLVGRIDAKANRKSGELVIHALYLEPNFKPSNLFTKSLAAQIKAFSLFNNCPNIIITKTSPNSYKQELIKSV